MTRLLTVIIRHVHVHGMRGPGRGRGVGVVLRGCSGVDCSNGIDGGRKKSLLQSLTQVSDKQPGIWFLKFVRAWPKSKSEFSWNGTVGWLMVPHVGGMGFSVIGPFVSVWPEKLERSSCNLPEA